MGEKVLKFWSSVKKDLEEFGSAVKNEANNVVSSTGAVLEKTLNCTIPLFWFQKAVYELQKDPNTFLCDPEAELSKQFQCWLEIIDDQLSDDRIAKHVNSSEVLKRQYAKLVPDIVEHQLFWKRSNDEVFNVDIELTEEEQIKLLEQYEIEKKNQVSPKRKVRIGEKKSINDEVPNLKLNKNDSAVSLDTPSSNSSTDGDWEKISDVEK
ncbi:hypothetical protein NQ314_015869 [Rhamnusium bicolor]|uniref:BSD domain-containing protein n=1 Tax=Rhamnusium bicolor TaxID=1586634 RepID=A0AAV8WYP8_9CUCU|nr:hypothetical protein NQ314_015869 [Rhamnusium bicolor]